MRSKGYCARCGLTFGTRWECKNHGCEQCGTVGLISQHIGAVILARFPAELHDPEMVWRLRDTLTVRREATINASAEQAARAFRAMGLAGAAITAAFAGFSAGLRSISDTLQRQVAPIFRNPPFAHYQPEPVEWLPSELTADSFTNLLRRFNAARPDPYFPEATIEYKTVVVRVNQCPVPAPEFPQRWAKLGENHIRRLNRHDKARARKIKQGNR